MSVQISVEHSFPMGHALLDYDGACSHIHGHNYKVEVSLDGFPNSTGFVLDFSQVKLMLKDIFRPFDHTLVLHLDDPRVTLFTSENPNLKASQYPQRLITLSCNPTAERLAQIWFRLIQSVYYESLVGLRVFESDTTSATVTDWDESISIVGRYNV